MAIDERALGIDPADLTTQRFTAALYGEGSYPQGAVFIDAEASFARDALMRNIREGRPAVVVFPDGLEKVIQPEAPIESRALSVRLRHYGRKVRHGRLLSLLA